MVSTLVLLNFFIAFTMSPITFLKGSIFFLFLLKLSACNFKEKPKEIKLLHSNGAVMRHYYTLKDTIEGKMIDYFPSGEVMAERLFEKGLQTGRSVFYFPNGKIKETQYFEEGKQQGGDTVWFENGKPEFVIGFKDGKKHGYMRKWNSEGEIIVEFLYNMDTLVITESTVPN